MISFTTYKFNNKEVDLVPRLPFNLTSGEVGNLQKIFLLDNGALQSIIDFQINGEFYELKKESEKYILSKKDDQSILGMDFRLSRGESVNFKVSDLKNIFYYADSINSAQIGQLITKNKKTLPQDLSNKQSDIKTLVEQRKQKLFEGKTDQQRNDIERLLEILTKLKVLGSEIDYYQNEKKLKEDLSLKVATKEKEKVVMVQKIDSVAVLTSQASSIQQQIQTLNIANAPQDISGNLQEIKRKRENDLEQNIGSIKVSRMEQEDKSPIKEQNLKLSPFAIVITVEVLLGILFYLLSFNVATIYVAIVSLLVLIIPPIAFSFLNLSRKSSESEELVLPVNEEKSTNYDLEDTRILNLSLYSALNSELTKINTSMSQRLGGMSVEDLKSNQQSLNKEIEELKKEQQKLESKTLTSEEYYKKRREVDIMKIEKENLQMNFPDVEESAAELIELNQQYAQINEEVDSLEEYNSTFPIVLAAKSFSSDVEDLVKSESERQIIRIVTG